ncbi:hypothetical protein BDW72DRAFT_199519 [Aspergillus terricola var. indicus]
MAERIPSSPMPRNRWESWEDDILVQQVLTHTGDPKDWQAKHGQGSIPWAGIAKALPGRSNKDCRKRWLKIDPRWNGGRWQSDEELRLTAAVMRHGYSWAEVSSAVGTRNPDQCSKLWHNAINPAIVRKEWNELDDLKLLDAVSRFGHQWSLIQQEFPDRSRLDLSNRAATITRRQRNSHCTNSASVTGDIGMFLPGGFVDHSLDLAGMIPSNMQTDIAIEPAASPSTRMDRGQRVMIVLEDVEEHHKRYIINYILELNATIKV